MAGRRNVGIIAGNAKGESVLQNWYFCAALGLSAQDSAAHLDTLAALEEPAHLKGSLEIACAAVDCLLAAESATMVHALPAVLAAHRRFAGAPEMARQASALYRAVTSITPEYIRPRMGALLRAAGSGAPGEAVDLLERAFSEVLSGDSHADADIPPYLDLVEQLAPTLVVAVGRFLAGLDPRLIRDRFPDPPTVVSDALRGRHGRLALVEAAELSAVLRPESANEVRFALARASAGAFDLEPDLLMAAARVTFGPEGRTALTPSSESDSASQEAVLDEIENEALTSTRLLAWAKDWRTRLDGDSPAADARRQRAYLRLGGVGAHRQSALPAVLWQAVLTSRSVEIAHDRSATRLTRWWWAPDGVPPARAGQRMRVSVPYEDYGDVLLHVTRLLSLRVPPGGSRAQSPQFVSGPAADTDPGTAATIWSPWMVEHPSKPAGRDTGAAPREKKKEAVSEWLRGDEPEHLIRLLGAGMIAERLLAGGTLGEAESENLLLLVVHIRDVLDRRYRNLSLAIEEHTGLGLVPASHLAGLLTHVRRLVDRLGKGNRPGLEPGELVRVLTALYAPQPRRPRPLENLVRHGAGLRAAVSWIRESFAGGVGPHRTEGGGRWFTGAAPAAQALLDFVAGRPEMAGWTAVEAALLRREIYGDVTAGVVRWDWVPGRGPVSPSSQIFDVDARTLLLSSPTDPGRYTFSVEEWESMAEDLERRNAEAKKNLGTPITVRTLRLIELLRRPELGDLREHEDWVVSWTELVKSFNAPLHLPRAVRGRMFDMFGSEVGGPGSQERLLTVLEHAVDVIIDLSAGAPYYYDRLFDVASSGMTLSGDDANRLRHRILRSVYDRWNQGGPATAHTNPYGAHGNRVSSRGTETALVRFLRATAHLPLQAHAMPLGTVMEQSWYQAYQPLPLAAVRQDADATGGDPRLIVATTADRRTGEVVRYAHSERLDIAVSGTRRVSVTDLFAADKSASPPADGAFVVGVVAGVDNSGPTTRLWINCGLPRLVDHDLGRLDRRWRAGRAVAVSVAANGGAPRRIATLAAPEPQPGEVRSARLRTIDRFPWLSLTIEGIDVDRYPSGADRTDADTRARWDPDLSRAFGDPGPEEPTTTLAVWNGDDKHWVPLDAGLPELAVAHGGAKDPEHIGEETIRLVVCGPAADRSGFGSAWRFATRPGRTYVLGESAWGSEDWERLEEELAQHSFALIVYAGFHPGTGRLRLADPVPFDDRNVRWLAAFDQAMPDADVSESAHDHDLYEEAVKTRDEQGKQVWRIEAPQVEGFPAWVTAEPSVKPRNDRDTLCTIKSWGEREARSATVEILPVEELGIEGTASLQRYEEMARLEEDSVVDLEVMLGKNPASGDNLVRTAFGICGFVETESLTLTGEFAVMSPAAPRLATVTKDEVRTWSRPARQPTPLPHRQLLDSCVELREPALLDRQRLTGMITTRIRGADRKVTHLRVWLRLGNEVVEAGPLPVACFDQDAPSVGDHVTVTRSAAGWGFTVLRRTLRMRALWMWEDSPGADWIAVGRVSGDGAPDMDLYQHRHLPRLAWAEAAETAEPETGRVRAMKADRQNRRPCRAVVQQAGRSLVGTASGAGADLTSEFQTVYLEQTQMWVEDVFDVEAAPGTGSPQTAYVDVRREFVLSPVAHSQRQPRAPRPAADPAAEWERVLAQSGGILTGPSSPEGRILLSLCQAPDDAGLYQPWIALLDEPRTLVAARTYLTDRVRCVPVPFGSGVRASHVLVPPVTVADFMAEVVPQARLNGKRCQIGMTVTSKKQRPYYVGVDVVDEAVVHRFEFGYGWFLDIPAEALTVEGKPVDPQGLTLFHGDRIDAMAFSRDPTGAVRGGIIVDVALADITKGIEYQIQREAMDAKVVHMLDVDIDHATGRVAVLRVHTRVQDFAAGREEVHVRDAAVSATLSPGDVAALLAAFGPQARRQRVLGRLNTEPGRPRREAPQFTVVPAVPSDGRGPGLRRGDSLYLEAGLAVVTRNDHLLRFGLHPLVEQPGEPLTVIVTRREFSHRESCLRRAVETDGVSVYEGRARMLVRLDDPRPDAPNAWRGSTKSPPARPLYLLRGYLDDVRRNCFGVVTAGGRHIEVRPGVLFPVAGISGADRIAAGSVVSLERRGDGVVARPAVPADATYLSQKPRPVVVFPKDSLKLQQDIDKADADGNFTLAGLPGINATARKGSGASLLQTRHPKIIGAVRAEARGNSAQLVPLDDVLAGTIAFTSDDPGSGARIVPAATSQGLSAPGDVAVPWAQLSFMDDSARQIATACTDRYWRYHDKVTRHWVPGQDSPKDTRLRPRARSIEEPVFLSPGAPGWTLRHDRASLRRFGFPATELLEEGGHDPEIRTRRAWAVASADTHGVWLELAPGRLVEVSAELVRFGDGASLADLDWSFFSPGDLVYGRVEGGVNEYGQLVLDAWRPGLRGALATGAATRMLLPVAHSDENAGALYLGEGATSFPYPADQAVLAAHPVASSVWLDRSNSLTAAEDSAVAVDDVVFLAMDTDRGALRVLGLPQARVRFVDGSVRGAWPGTGWLRQVLEAANDGVRLPSGLDGVPVTVEGVEAGPVPVLTVSRRTQPRGEAPTGSVLAQPVADLGRGFIAVRSGSALFRVGMGAILPGMPQSAAAAAAAAFVADGGTLRLYWDPETRSLSGGPGAGQDQAAAQGETTVRPLLTVDTADAVCLGLVCRDEQSRRLCWLGADDAAWARGLPGTILMDHLRGLRRLAVLRTAPGKVTLTGHPVIAREYRNLAVGERVRVRVVESQVPAGAGAGGVRSLVSVEPAGMLAAYTVPDSAVPPRAGDSMMAEISRIERGSGSDVLSLVEPGSRLTVVDLPQWVCESLGRLYEPRLLAELHPVDDLIPERFEGYLRTYREGQTGSASVADEPASDRVLRALGSLDGEQGRTQDGRQEAAAAVVAWLCSAEGRAAVLQQDTEIDLAPVLTVCRLGARLGDQVRLPAGWLAYLLARIGDRAVSSLHTEALVTRWLAQPTRHGQSGDWRRLRTVRIAPKLTAKEVSDVRAFGQAITGRLVITGKESEAAAVARSLLMAVGHLPSAQLVREDAENLSRLADLGAGLRPPHGAGVPEWSLLNLQKAEVESLARKVLNRAIPLVLLPATEPVTPAVRIYGSNLMQAAEAESRRG